MSLKDALSKLMDGANRPSHSYRLSIDTFAELDPEKVARDLKIAERAVEQGKEEEPPTSAKTPSKVEQEIIDHLERERKAAEGTAAEQLETYNQRLGALDFVGCFSTIRNAGLDAVAEFKVEAMQGRDHLHEKRRDLLDLENEFDSFRKRHRLSNRTAYYSQGVEKMLKIGFIVFLFSVEVGINSIFLAKGSEQGLIEGFAKAITFAALNIGFTYLITCFGIRCLAHRNLLLKGVGISNLRPVCIIRWYC